MKTNNNIDLTRYSQFVEGVTSKASNDIPSFRDSIDRLSSGTEGCPAINVPLLITASMGMNGEAGEFSEIVKKLVFHGKSMTTETHQHLQKELGDVIWYWTNACRSIGVNPNQVIADNVAKLEARYPGGEFNVWSSENRKDGDI